MTRKTSISIKLIISCLAMMIIVSMPMIVKAAEADTLFSIQLDKSRDYSEMKSLIPEMKEWARDENLYDNDIDVKNLNHAYRIYTDFNPGEIKDNKISTLKSYLKNSDYVWEVPVNISGKTYTYIVGKGLPLSENGKKNLTEKEQAQIMESEGKLKIYSFGEGKDLYDAIRKIASEKKYDQVFVVGGIQGDRSSYVLGIKNNKADTFISLSDSAGVENVSWNDMQMISKKALTDTRQNDIGGSLTVAENNRSASEVYSNRMYVIMIIIVGISVITVSGIIYRNRYKER